MYYIMHWPPPIPHRAREIKATLVAPVVSYSLSLVKPSLIGISPFTSAYAGGGQLFISR